MLDIREPSFTRRVVPDELQTLGITSLLYGGQVDEERASTIVSCLVEVGAVEACRVELEDDAVCRVPSLDKTVNLFERSDLDNLVSLLPGRIAIDLTSLEHRVWVPILRALIDSEVEVIALYAEPDDYRRSDELPGANYDLSTSRGIEPLPGFAKLSRTSGEESHFAPLLGFEGARLGHIFDQEDVDVNRTSPIIGSPGFRVEYPTYAYLANRDWLALDHMERHVEFAKASCPFEAYRALERIHRRVGGRYLRVAPIGTKPHALGAVLYAIHNPASVELIYDHPVRSKGRTFGTRSVYVYDVAAFLSSLGT